METMQQVGHTLGQLLVKDAGKARCDPFLHYKEKIASGEVQTTHESTLKPRNPRQVKNAQFTAQQEQRYTQDDLFNLVELAQDIPGYIHRTFLVPELGVVLAHRSRNAPRNESCTVCPRSPVSATVVRHNV